MEAEAVAVAAEAVVVGDLHGGRLEAHLVTLPNPLAVPDHQVLVQVLEDLLLVRHGEDHHPRQDHHHREDHLLLVLVLEDHLDQE